MEIALAGLVVLDLGAAARALKQQNRDGADEASERAVWRGLVANGLYAGSGVPPRIFIPSFRENAGMRYGWSSPYGYVSLSLGRVWNYMHDGLGLAPPVERNTFPSPEIAGFGPFPYPSMALAMGVDPRTQRLALNKEHDPRVYLASAAQVVGHAGEATARMRAGHDFHAVALVEQPVGLPLQAAPGQGRADITRFAAESLSIAVESAAPALLVLAEPWYPGWEARVNGAPGLCIPANAWMRAVLVPAGKSQVEFTFHSTYLATGAAISLAALAVILILLLRRRAAQPV
jgi:hypothetical protein